MKILIILKKWPGGVGIMVQEIKKKLEEKGHYVKVISREEDLKIKSFAKSIFPLRNEVIQLMKKENFDIIYSRDWSIAFPLLFPLPLFKKIHYSGFGGLEKGKISFLLEKIVGKIMGEKLICYGDPVKREFPKATQIINGVDKDKFKPSSKVKRIKNSVGFASQKNSDYNYSLIKETAENLGMKFILAEGIPHEDMPDFYNKVETFISLPPNDVGFNFVWIEAMASRVPKIIGSNVGIGNRLPIDKIEEFESLEEAIKKAHIRDYQKLLKGNFSWEQSANKHLQLWDK